MAVEAFGAVRGLRVVAAQPDFWVGTLAGELLLATASGPFAITLGAPVGLAELLFVNVSVSCSPVLPSHGGIGVVQGGLIYGLASAVMPEDASRRGPDHPARHVLPLPLWASSSAVARRNKHM